MLISLTTLQACRMNRLTEETITINLHTSKDLFEKLRKKAAEEELTYSAFIRQLIKKAVE